MRRYLCTPGNRPVSYTHLDVYKRQLISGISLGSVYAIIALGYTMVYGIAKMLNFAHGDVIMVGSYVVYVAVSGMGLNPVSYTHLDVYKRQGHCICRCI